MNPWDDGQAELHSAPATVKARDLVRDGVTMTGFVRRRPLAVFFVGAVGVTWVFSSPS